MEKRRRKRHLKHDPDPWLMWIQRTSSSTWVWKKRCHPRDGYCQLQRCYPAPN